MKYSCLAKYSLLLVVFFTSVNSALAKDRIQKGFERLAVKDYFEAREYFMKETKSDPAPSYYGLSIICTRNDNPFFNIDSARKYILLADTAYNRLSEKGKLEVFEKYNLMSANIPSQRDTIAMVAYQMTEAQNDVEKWNVYLDQYGWSKLKIYAEANRNRLAYSGTKKINTAAAYYEFITKYPRARETTEAKQHYEEKLFAERTNPGDANSFAAFIASFPESPFRFQAEDSLFELLTARKDPDAYYGFAKKYPTNRNISKAWMQLYNRYISFHGSGTSEQFLKDYPDFPYKNEVADDFRLFNTEMLPTRYNGKWGYIDTDGKLMVGYDFDEVDFFYDGLSVASKNNKYGFINKKGTVVVNFDYDDVDRFENGSAIVHVKDKATIINRIGEMQFDTLYEEVGSPHDDRVLVMHDDKYGYTDSHGKVIIPVQFETATDFMNRLAVAGSEDYLAVIDRNGNRVIDTLYSFISIEPNGLIRAQRDDMFGIYNRFGEQVLPFEYDAIGKFAGGMAIISKDDKFGFINDSAKITIPLTYDFDSETLNRSEFKNGYAVVKLKNKYGLIDLSGNVVLPVKYDDVRFYNDSTPVAVRKQNKWGYVDLDNKTIVPFIYENALEFTSDLGRVKQRNLYGAVDSTGSVVIPFEYKFISEFKNGFAIASRDTLFGLITKANETIVFPQFDKYQFLNNGIIRFDHSGKFGYYSIFKKEWVWKEEGL